LGVGATEPASAATVTVVMTGELTAIDDSNDVTDGSLVIGVPYVLTMVYDDSIPDQDPDLLAGHYVVPAGSAAYAVSVGNYSFESASVLDFGLFDGFFDPSEDSLGWFADQFTSTGALDPGAAFGLFGYSSTQLTDYTGTALASDSLVAANWNRNSYAPDANAFYLFVEVLDPRTTDRDYLELKGTIDDIVTTVPEADPSWLLALTASLGLYRKRMLAPSR
jgi:hypothetical protein